MIGEKRVNKNFQYDSPGDLVITYLSEVTKDCLYTLTRAKLYICLYVHVNDVSPVMTCSVGDFGMLILNRTQTKQLPPVDSSSMYTYNVYYTKCSIYSGTSLIWTPLGQKKVS